MSFHKPSDINEVKLSSPCVRNCCLDQRDICLGCFRSLEEITQWTQVDEQTRQSFLANANMRKHQFQQK